MVSMRPRTWWRASREENERAESRRSMNWFKRKRSSRYPASERWKEDYKNSDYGRKYGWWLCLDGERIADLDYRIWDCYSQFWHVYQIFPFSSRFEEIGLDPDSWCLDRVSMESRYAPGFSVKRVLMAERARDLVAIRSVYLPKEVFEKAHREARQLLDPET